eukprot:SAG31_NODE_4957_length_2836_cov_2.451023_2_plen_173_part_00
MIVTTKKSKKKHAPEPADASKQPSIKTETDTATTDPRLGQLMALLNCGQHEAARALEVAGGDIEHAANLIMAGATAADLGAVGGAVEGSAAVDGPAAPNVAAGPSFSPTVAGGSATSSAGLGGSSRSSGSGAGPNPLADLEELPEFGQLRAMVTCLSCLLLAVLSDRRKHCL